MKAKKTDDVIKIIEEEINGWLKGININTKKVFAG